MTAAAIHDEFANEQAIDRAGFPSRMHARTPALDTLGHEGSAIQAVERG